MNTNHIMKPTKTPRVIRLTKLEDTQIENENFLFNKKLKSRIYTKANLSSSTNLNYNKNPERSHIFSSTIISPSKVMGVTSTTQITGPIKETSLPFFNPNKNTGNNMAYGNVIRFNDRLKIKKSIIVHEKPPSTDFHINSNSLGCFDKKFITSNQSSYHNSYNSQDKNLYNLYKSNIPLIKRIMNENPYKEVPKKVKYSFYSQDQLKHQTFTNLRNHKISKLGFQIKNLGTTTLLYKKANKTQNLLTKLLNVTEDTSGKLFKKAIKMKNIKWIINNKGAYVDLLVNCYKEVKWFFNSRGGKLDKTLFNEYFTLLNKKGGKDNEFTDLIFLIFDDDKDGIVDYKEIIVWFILFNNDSYQRKLENLIEICLIGSKSNLVQLDEFFRLLKSFTLNKSEAKKFPEIVTNVMANFKSCEIDKNELIHKLVSNEEIKYFILRNTENANELENVYDDEIATISKMNLKRSKIQMNPELRSACTQDFVVFDRILAVRNKCIQERKRNYRLGYIDHDSFSEDEK